MYGLTITTSKEQYALLTNAQLRAEIERRNAMGAELKVSGVKDALASRLAEHNSLIRAGMLEKAFPGEY